jgi:N-methylhydantoinase A/oxoprolinase/acetone carboxylase beta subunit
MAALIREVGVSTMLVPLYPGVLCALGCVYADLRYDLSQTAGKALRTNWRRMSCKRSLCDSAARVKSSWQKAGAH